MNDNFVWLEHPDTGGYFRCPAAAVGDWLDMGWELAPEPPAEPNPVADEHLAWREQQDQAAAAAKQTDSKPTKTAARRGAENGAHDG